LKKTGIIDTLTKGIHAPITTAIATITSFSLLELNYLCKYLALASLYEEPEKPKDPIEYP
jgi:hypothetical protein